MYSSPVVDPLGKNLMVGYEPIPFSLAMVSELGDSASTFAMTISLSRMKSLARFSHVGARALQSKKKKVSQYQSTKKKKKKKKETM